jgi:hypothetical protein
MRHVLIRAAVVSAMWIGVAPDARGEVTAEQVRQAIQMGVNFLKSQQDKVEGSWPEHAGQPGGLTALCTLALLTAGEEPTSPALRNALSYLRNLPPPNRTYATALQTMALAAAEPERDLAIITRNARWLEQTQVKQGFRAGNWGYGDQGSGDHSNTQFALMGLHEAERVGVSIDPRVWERSLDYFQKAQRNDGSWAYYELPPSTRDQPLPSTGSMTCAGLGALLICTDHLGRGESDVLADGSVRCCGVPSDNDRIERAIQWLGRYPLSSNPGMNTWHLYFLYGVERVGRLSGRRYLGDQDWYRVGAEVLVARQDRLNGQWRGPGLLESNPTLGTAFALLFLAKGRRPVVISELDWTSDGPSGDWNRHAAALHNLTREVELSWEQELTWQTVRLKQASVNDLLQSPVLFLRGTEAFSFTETEKENLREYINQGGFLFAEACDGMGCNGQAFDRSFRELMAELFPDTPLRELPPDHPMWYAERRVSPQHLPSDMWLYGVDACCRTSVVYSNKTLTCLWELHAGRREAAYSESTKQQVQAAMNLGQNVLAYATNRELRDKLDQPTVRERDESDRLLRGTLYVPKISHGGGSDDAPNALANLLQLMREQLQMRVNTERRLLPPTDIQLFDYPIAFMHGRRAFRFSSAERQAMAEYLRRGGFVFGDAICASSQFANSFRREFESLFPGTQFVRLPPDHPIYTQEFRGSLLERVTLRDPQVRSEDDPLRATLTDISPLLEGLEIDGRLVVIFSPYDLSCGLENQTSLECKGYIKQDAARLGINILLFALGQ